jgi:arsenate reductase
MLRSGTEGRARGELLHPMTERIYNVLFLCTGNSARSILAESILNRLGKGQFRGFSAGSHPNGQVNPFALEVLNRLDFPTEGLRSKSWDEFTTPASPQFDFIITVCDNAAGETCPTWLGKPTTAHWGIPDPAALQGTDIEKKRAFNQAFKSLDTRIKLFLSLPIASLDQLRLKQEVTAIGKAPLAESAP